MNQELIRIVDNIARDKNIDRESIFRILSRQWFRRHEKYFGLQHGDEGDIVITIDRTTGQITAYKDDVRIDIRKLGRIPAQTAKQVMIQKSRRTSGTVFMLNTLSVKANRQRYRGRHEGSVLVVGDQSG